MKTLRALFVSILLVSLFQYIPSAQASNCRTIQDLSEKLRLHLALNKPFTNQSIDDNTKYYQLALKTPSCVSSSQYKIIVDTTKGIQSDCLNYKKGTWEYQQSQALWNNKWEYQCKSIKKIKLK
jgi:hypothetical protein